MLSNIRVAMGASTPMGFQNTLKGGEGGFSLLFIPIRFALSVLTYLFNLYNTSSDIVCYVKRRIEQLLCLFK